MNDDGYGSMLASLLSSTSNEVPTSTFVPQLTREWPVTDLEAFRAELLQWLRESWDPSVTVREWWARLAAAGLTMPTWPRSYGGMSAPTAVQQLIETVFASTGMLGPPLGGIGLRQIGPALRQHATLDQCERMLRPLMKGLDSWCVLLAEPDHEMAQADTTAVADGTTVTIDGDKSWSPDVDGAAWALVLAVTEPTAHIKRRMTCFAVDMAQPGVQVVIDEKADTRIVRLQSVAADRRDAIGGEGAGWAVAQTVIAHAQTSLAGRIRRGVVDVAPGEAAGNLDIRVDEAVAAYQARAKRNVRRDQPGSDRRNSITCF